MQAYYPITAPVRTAATEPTILQEPVSLDEAKKQCSVAEAINYHDAAISRHIVAARQQVEHDAMVVCYTGTFTYKLTEFGWRDYFEIPNIKPVTAVSSIAYINTGGTSTTWGASEYTLDASGLVPIVRLNYGYSWPTLRGEVNGITVTLTAGYSSPLAVPAKIKQAVLLALHIAWLYSQERPDEAQRQQIGYDRQIELIRLEPYG